ncbi:DUF1810 domain-containing protein [Palleronia caenipelagi]|uniref:DUF1810 domain-containing protein n=1 Tax=Palleronia caenipelagi TaxID=2489174 RepID=A0A547Q9Y2_9RHOB|nr:DUF1810 domain-containing protein [Palleronia caenipelagi]TRD23198.1 DUF1810 domain-containing protein [Palleronia caenipelagi]
MKPDADDLQRFVTAQDGSFSRARDEIRRGRKESHWMWYIYPQLRGLGRSEQARYYGVAGLDEAERYLAHRVLGPRLIEMFEVLHDHRGTPLDQIFGPVDALKLRSSATLFATVPDAPRIFADVLATLCGGPCPLTEERL